MPQPNLIAMSGVCNSQAVCKVDLFKCLLTEPHSLQWVDTMATANDTGQVSMESCIGQ